LFFAPIIYACKMALFRGAGVVAAINFTLAAMHNRWQ
jgi:hypothetical protein